MKRLALLLLCISSATTLLRASIEPVVSNTLPGTVFMSGSGMVSSAAVTPSNPNFTLKAVKNTVKLYSDPNATTLINFDYRLEVPVKITALKYQGATPTVMNDVLVIDFHPDPKQRREYQQTDAFVFTDGYSVDVQVQPGIVCKDLNGGSLLPQQLLDLSTTVFISNEIEVERYFAFNPGTPLSPTAFTITPLPTRELQLDWQPIDGAEEYDLEWIFVDDYDSTGYAKLLSANTLRFNFEQNSARVQLKKPPFLLPLVYERGYLMFRVRGIGRSAVDNFTAPVPGTWSCAGAGCAGFISNFPTQFRYQVTQNQVYENDRMNWQSVASYAEEGKRKTLVSHFDGGMNNRQSVTVLSTERMALVGETIMDYQGRAAIQVLPAPVKDPTIKFFKNFNQNLNQTPYGPEDFDKDKTTCSSFTGPMRSTSTGTVPNLGASNYYSPSNPDQSGAQARLPDAENFPFTQTEFMPDNTGRIRRQSGVGGTHQLNGGHETKYFYGTPAQEELDRLFGNEAGNALHYKKNMVQDANQQLSITYLDPKGNTVATALAGKKPDALLALDSYQDPQTAPLITVDLLAANVVDTTDFSLTSERTLTVSCPGDYEFVYKMTGEQFQDLTCMATKVCYDCIYDLELLVLDNLNCNQVLFSHMETIGKLWDAPGVPSTTCQNPAFGFDTNTDLPTGKSFKINFKEVGTYTVLKKLKVNQAAADAYVQHFLNDPSNLCSQKLDEFLQAEYSKIDSSGCNIGCDDIDSSELNNPNLSAAQIQALKEDIADMKEALCDSTLSLCETAYAAMLADVSPGGQYGWLPGAPPANPEDAYLSVFAPNSQLSGGGPQAIFRNLSFPDKNGLPYKIDVGNGWVNVNDASVSLEDFVDNWQPEWAEVLVKSHPEYCYYQFCIDHLQQKVTIGSNQTSSEAYDMLMLSTEKISDAGMRDYLDLNGLNADLIAQNDPFFNGAMSAFGVGMGSITPKIGNFTTGINSTQKLSMKQLAIALANCPDNPTPACYTANWSSTNDREWIFYRTLYTTVKQQILYEKRSEYAINNHCYNGCIGSNPFDVWRFNFWNGHISDPFFDYAQPCSVGKFYNLANKTKRFPSVYDLLPPGFTLDFYHSAPKDVLDAIYQANKQEKGETCCDLGAHLPEFLNILLQKGPGTYAFPDATSNWPPDVLDILLNGQPGMSVVVSKTGGKYAFQFLDINKNQRCLITLNLGSGSGGKFNGLCCFSMLQPGAGTGDFSMTAQYSTGNVSVLGKIDHCNIQCPEVSGRECPLTRDALDWVAAFNYMAALGNLVGAHWLPQTGIGSYLAGAIVNGEPQCSTLMWHGAQTGPNVQITLSAYQCSQKCQIDLVLPTGVNLSDVTYCLGIQPDLNQLDLNQHTRGFFMTLKLKNDTIVVVQGMSSCFTISFCCHPNFVKFGAPPVLGINTPEDILKNCRNCATMNISGGIFAGPLGNCPLECDSIVEITMPIPDSCGKHMVDIARYNAEMKFEQYLDSLKAAVRQAYMKKCLAAVENFWVTYRDNQHHFTLYFYDQANNLVKTVPPAGVVPLSPADVAAVAAHRRSPKLNPAKFAVHNLVSNYRYNSLNQLSWQKIPDHTAESYFFYDNVGRLVASANARQRAKGKFFSYTMYDKLGRIKEVGEVKPPSMPPTYALFLNVLKAKARDYKTWENWLLTGVRTEITQTTYDRPTGNVNFPQKNLRGRVSAVQWLPSATTIIAGQTSEQQYSYDVHGNVEALYQRSFWLDPKVMYYRYDLLSGKVNELAYQPGQPDQFFHRYSYNADNQLTEVRTSADGWLWETDAKYRYFPQGSLARMELGADRVQGMDYTYTIQGWIKGVNSGSLQPKYDPGQDEKNFAADATGYILGYYDRDYFPIYKPAGSFQPDYLGSNLNKSGLAPELFNGNIRHIVTANKAIMANDRPMAMLYAYDQLNRLCTAVGDLDNFDPQNNQWTAGKVDPRWQNALSYDANGNILTQTRTGDQLNLLPMDDMTYHYYPNTNRLEYVTDKVGNNDYKVDIDQERTANYSYDEIGNLVGDIAEGLTIDWNLSGKVSKIVDGDKPGKTITFGYNPMGARVLKNVDGVSTYHVLDATGNILATYRMDASGTTLESEWIYGSSRLGEYHAEKCLLGCAPGNTPKYTHIPGFRGKRRYELSNHLGNVLATVSDRKLPGSNSSTVTAFTTDVLNAQEYYAFGMLMPGRTAGAAGRFGFNGKENVDEVEGTGNFLDFGERAYDTKICRFYSMDLQKSHFPNISSYSFSANSPILFVDINGEFPFPSATDFVKSLKLIRQSFNLNTVSVSGGIQGAIGAALGLGGGVAIDKYNNVLIFSQTFKGVQGSIGVSVSGSIGYSSSKNVKSLLGKSLALNADVSTGVKFLSVGGNVEGSIDNVTGGALTVGISAAVSPVVNIGGGKTNTTGIIVKLWELETIEIATNKLKGIGYSSAKEWNQNEAEARGGWSNTWGEWQFQGTTTSLDKVGENLYEVVIQNRYYYATNFYGRDVSEEVKTNYITERTGVIFEKDESGNLISKNFESGEQK